MSHELDEAATNPFVNSQPAFGQVDDPHTIWDIGTFGGEVADMCQNNSDSNYTPPGSTYMVQRSWSNAAAKAGTNPCVPVPATGPYFNSYPTLPDMVTLTAGSPSGGPITTEGVKIPVGQSRTIDVVLHSEAATSGPWTVAVQDLSQYYRRQGRHPGLARQDHGERRRRPPPDHQGALGGQEHRRGGLRDSRRRSASRTTSGTAPSGSDRAEILSRPRPLVGGHAEVRAEPPLVGARLWGVRRAGARDELIDAGGERGVAHGAAAEGLDGAGVGAVGDEVGTEARGSGGEGSVRRNAGRTEDGQGVGGEGEGRGQVVLDVEHHADRAGEREVGIAHRVTGDTDELVAPLRVPAPEARPRRARHRSAYALLVASLDEQDAERPGGHRRIGSRAHPRISMPVSAAVSSSARS